MGCCSRDRGRLVAYPGYFAVKKIAAYGIAQNLRENLSVVFRAFISLNLDRLREVGRPH